MRTRALLGCLAAVILLAGVGVLAYTILGPDIQRFLSRSASAPEAASPAAAESADAKMRRLLEEGEEVRLSSAEAAIVFDTQLAGWIPPEFRRPGVALAGDTLLLHAAVPTEHLPRVSEIDAVRGLLPDTAQVEISGRLHALEPGTAEFDVVRIRVGRIPIPARYYPAILDGLGREADDRVGPSSVALPLPAPVRAARVEQSHLVLTP